MRRQSRYPDIQNEESIRKPLPVRRVVVGMPSEPRVSGAERVLGKEHDHRFLRLPAWWDDPVAKAAADVGESSVPQTARRILVLISEQPGIITDGLARRLDLNRTVVNHHVSRLARKGLVSTRVFRRRRHHFLAGVVPAMQPTWAALQSPLVGRLLAEILRRPDAALRDVSTTLGVSPASVRRCLRMMQASAVLQPSAPPSLAFTVNPGLHGYVAAIRAPTTSPPDRPSVSPKSPGGPGTGFRRDAPDDNALYHGGAGFPVADGIGHRGSDSP